jgi:hypothetical protein
MNELYLGPFLGVCKLVEFGFEFEEICAIFIWLSAIVSKEKSMLPV